MGVVYKAEDTRLHRLVALKFLPHEFTFNEDARSRFIREAQAAGALDHPNICPIYDVNETDDGVSYIAMAYCEGESLREMIDRGPFPVDECLDVAAQVAAGLNEAHTHGIVHRDIKPTNILVVRDGLARIVDFGLAKLRGKTKLTKENTTVGTVEYMSPEQARGEDVDHRTDIWSAGCVIYEMITGTTPFRGDYEQAVVYSILNAAPPPLTGIRSGIPMELERIITKCLEKDPGDRYQSAMELAVDLKHLRRTLSSAPTTRVPVTEPARSWKKHIIPVAAGFLFLVSTVLLLISHFSSPEQDVHASVAVLPFTNLSGTAAEDYFADGIADDILTQLYKVGDLRVTSRTTMQQYRQTTKSIREIGEELHATAIVEGSVRREGDRIRLVIQLIDAGTDDHLWAETYDKKLDDVFAVQSEIARNVARTLHARLSPTEEKHLTAVPVSNVQAYNLILEGSHYFSKGTRDDVYRAIEKFQEALAIDSGSARAWAQLATAWARLSDVGALETGEGYEKARSAAQKALLLDDGLAMAHTIMGWIKRSYDWDWEGAERECRKALDIAPGDVTVIRNMANLEKTLGKFESAITHMKRAVELDPKKPPIYTSLGLLSMYAGYLEQAASAYREAITLNPKYPAAHTFLGLVYLLEGNQQEAVREIQLEDDPGWKAYGLAQAYFASSQETQADSALRSLKDEYGEESMYQVAQVYAYRNEADSAFAWLTMAYEVHDGGLTEILGDPFMKNIERDPRYHAFLKKLRLSDPDG